MSAGTGETGAVERVKPNLKALSFDARHHLLITCSDVIAAAERMRQIFGTQLGPALGPVCPQPAALVASQVLGMALCRYVLRLPPVAAAP